MPAVVDLAAMRDAMASLGGDPQKINPLVPVDLVIDHSVIVDEFGTPTRLRPQRRARIRAQRGALPLPEMGPAGVPQLPRRAARHRHLPPGQSRISRPDRLDQTDEDGDTIAYPDTCVGTDSHTTMVNGLGVLGWGVGGIEAEAAMLGQPVSMLLPEVIGFRLTGKLKEGVTATDLVLTVTQMLRKKGVVGKFVEFFGPGLSNMTLADRATIGNMAPGIRRDLRLLPGRRRDDPLPDHVGPRREPHRAGRGLFQGAGHVARQRRLADPVFTDTLELDLGDRRAVDGRPEASGRPRRAGRHRVGLRQGAGDRIQEDRSMSTSRYAVEGTDYDLGHGDVVIAAITSCTNTSNPIVLIGAGLLARNANRRGLKQKPWVKTSLAPGQPGGRRISRKVRPAEGARPDRLQPRRLRLHHLHRQFRPAAGADLQDHQRQGPDRRRRAVGQPQLRRPRLARRAGQLSRLAAAGRRLCAGRHGAPRI